MIFLGYITLALLPGFFWLWFYRRKDREKPEPLKLVIKVFLWGMLATIPAIALEITVDYFIPYASSKNLTVIVLSALFIVAPIEEYLKYLVVKEKVYHHEAFDEVIDGVVYCVVAALGFASFENILVVFSVGTTAIFLRFATATLMHALTSGIIGYYMGLAKFNEAKEKRLIIEGLFIAIVLHALYNIVATTNNSLTIFLLVSLLITMYLMLAKGIKEAKEVDSKA